MLHVVDDNSLHGGKGCESSIFLGIVRPSYNSTCIRPCLPELLLTRADAASRYGETVWMSWPGEVGLEDQYDMSSDATIDYEALTQDAMRGVVRQVLERTAKHGLPGEHHFYVSFDTLAPGVVLSKRLRDKYAEEMTIVLQHRFWDLVVSDDRFEVKLTFDGIPERLVIPFKSIKVFFDPSVRYGLQFEAVDLGQGEQSNPMIVDRGDLGSGELPELRPDHQAPGAGAAIGDGHDGDGQTTPKIVANAEAKPSVAAEADGEDGVEDDDGQGDSNGAEIVSLDAFRKK